MNFLVTGGAGFIGSNLVNFLLEQNHNVLVIDNLHTGSIENLKGKNVKFFKEDVGKINSLSLPKLDCIFHNGIYSSSPMYKENPKLVAKALDDFIELLEFCKKTKTKLVFASTSSVYNGISPPHKEDAILKVTDFYTETRIAMERIAKLYSDLYDLKIIGLRYFSVYGPGEKAKGKYANLISQFLWDLLEDKQPMIYGDGSQTRDFIYVDDVVRANFLAFNSNIKFGIYNVGTGKSYSLNEVLQILNSTLNKKIKPIYVENKIKNYVLHTKADVTKAKKELGFSASVSIKEGIKKLIDFYKSQS
jgi:UDP-glucose 4-epimerase